MAGRCDRDPGSACVPRHFRVRLRGSPAAPNARRDAAVFRPSSAWRMLRMGLSRRELVVASAAGEGSTRHPAGPLRQLESAGRPYDDQAGDVPRQPRGVRRTRGHGAARSGDLEVAPETEPHAVPAGLSHTCGVTREGQDLLLGKRPGRLARQRLVARQRLPAPCRGRIHLQVHHGGRRTVVRRHQGTRHMVLGQQRASSGTATHRRTPTVPRRW